MMVIKSLVKRFFRAIKGIESWSAVSEKTTIYKSSEEGLKEEDTIISIWDVLAFKENTQAYHLNSVIGFEEWVDMEEILRRIKELFGIEYKNFRSLYPYLKTLVDLGLMETTSVGGRRKWRKLPLLVKTKPEKNERKKQENVLVVRERKETEQD